MTYYALKDGARVVGVVQQEAPPDREHAILRDATIPRGSFPGAELQERDGALYWERGAVENALRAVRDRRNRLLAECDWTQLPDVPPQTAAMWQPYRQALRDITDQPDPFSIAWPVKPG